MIAAKPNLCESLVHNHHHHVRSHLRSQRNWGMVRKRDRSFYCLVLSIDIAAMGSVCQAASKRKYSDTISAKIICFYLSLMDFETCELYSSKTPLSSSDESRSCDKRRMVQRIGQGTKHFFLHHKSWKIEDHQTLASSSYASILVFQDLLSRREASGPSSTGACASPA
jgi:hypothetical protein